MQGAIVVGLKNRFKERRRLKKPRKPPELHFSKPQKSPAVKIHDLPDIPAGEDETSFERHNRVLNTEFTKPTPNASNVKQIMQLTYAMRRREILSLGHTKDYNALRKFPFLQVPYHVSLY